MVNAAGVLGLRKGRNCTPVFLPDLDPGRYRIKSMAVAIPEKFVIPAEIDDNRQTFQPARRFDLGESFSVGDRRATVLVCCSNEPESRSGGRVTTIRWPWLPVKPVHLLRCWLLILGHESINLKINCIARRITKASVREGKRFAWYGFRLGDIIQDLHNTANEATIRGIGIFPSLPGWNTTFRVAPHETHVTKLTMKAQARQAEGRRRAA